MIFLISWVIILSWTHRMLWIDIVIGIINPRIEYEQISPSAAELHAPLQFNSGTLQFHILFLAYCYWKTPYRYMHCMWISSSTHNHVYQSRAQMIPNSVLRSLWFKRNNRYAASPICRLKAKAIRIIIRNISANQIGPNPDGSIHILFYEVQSASCYISRPSVIGMLQD